MLKRLGALDTLPLVKAGLVTFDLVPRRPYPTRLYCAGECGVEGSLRTTKLYIPPTRPKLVPRPRLLEHLDQGVVSYLILVSVRAGFGKTTLVAMLHAQLAGPSSCDETG